MRPLATLAVLAAAVASIATSEEEPQASSQPAGFALEVAGAPAELELVATLDSSKLEGPVEVVWMLDLSAEAELDGVIVSLRADVDPGAEPALSSAIAPGGEVRLDGTWRTTVCEPIRPCELRYVLAADGADSGLRGRAVVRVAALERGRALPLPTLQVR